MIDDDSVTARTMRAIREEWTKPYREALEEIANANPVDMALDPGWAARIAKAALEGQS